MSNPRIQVLRNDVEQRMLKPLRSHGWLAEFVAENDAHSSIEVSATKNERTANFAIVYSSATANEHYQFLAKRNENIFFHGQAYQLESFTRNISVPVEPLDDFFPVLIRLNKEQEPVIPPPTIKRKKKKKYVRITDENPLQAVFARLEQFTSIKLAQKLVIRRCEYEGVSLDDEVLLSKAEGIAYSMRNALDYFNSQPGTPLNKIILSQYYGSIAFAFVEMLADPNGPRDLDEVEGMTKQGHGLYIIPSGNHSFSDLRIGLLATGFMPNWFNHLGYDTSEFPRRKAKNISDIEKYSSDMSIKLSELFGAFPEIEDLYSEVFGKEPSWLIPYYNSQENQSISLHKTRTKAESSYCLFKDYSGLIDISRLENAGLPIAEITKIVDDEESDAVAIYRARIDHTGLDYWHEAIPLHSSKGKYGSTLLLPTIGGVTDYRVTATTMLYALSILVRYMPNTWRRVEGGEADQYIAIIKASLAIWERTLPEQFLESILGERVHTTQPGSWMG